MNMYPRTMTYYRLHVSRTRPPEGLPPPAEKCEREGMEWWDWHFADENDAQGFRTRLLGHGLKVFPVDECLYSERPTPEQYNHWLGRMQTCEQECYYIRNLDVMDEEETRLFEDANTPNYKNFAELFKVWPGTESRKFWEKVQAHPDDIYNALDDEQLDELQQQLITYLPDDLRHLWKTNPLLFCDLACCCEGDLYEDFIDMVGEDDPPTLEEFEKTLTRFA